MNTMHFDMAETSAPPPAPSNPTFVLPGQAVGWAAVDKAVRDFDEQMVKDYKEDIDTLLTFVSRRPQFTCPKTQQRKLNRRVSSLPR